MDMTFDGLFSNEELQSLIPHRGKMLLLSRVKEYNPTEGHLCAEYDITKECIFYDPLVKGVPTWAGFEFMAQAISVLSGIKDSAKGIKPRMGFILSIPSMKIHVPFFKLGNHVEVRVKENDCVDLVYNFDGEAFLEGKKVMEGKLMVMEIDEERMNSLIKENSFVK